jgi:hypothetical protein
VAFSLRAASRLRLTLREDLERTVGGDSFTRQVGPRGFAQPPLLHIMIAVYTCAARVRMFFAHGALAIQSEKPRVDFCHTEPALLAYVAAACGRTPVQYRSNRPRLFGAIAGLVRARRAVRAEPMVALRHGQSESVQEAIDTRVTRRVVRNPAHVGTADYLPPAETQTVRIVPFTPSGKKPPRDVPADVFP